MALSLHIVVDGTSNELLDRSLLYLVRTKQRSVDIAAGSQIDRGMQFVERVRAALPRIKIFWRVLEDTGIHSKLSVDEWWQQRVAPRLTWMIINQVIMVLDNESSGDDRQIRYYVEWSTAALRKLHAATLRGAVARFATGNIDDGGQHNDQYPLLKPLFAALVEGDYVAPNEYSNAPGKSSAGNIGRYKLMEAVAGKKLPIVIGEAGVLVDYDPYKGYRLVMTDEQFVAQMLAEEVWYRPEIDRHLFAVSGDNDKWGSMQMTENVMRFLEEHYAKNPIPQETKPVAKKDVTIRIVNTNTRVRTEPTINSSIVYVLQPALIEAIMYDEPQVQANGYSWQKFQINGRDGWIAMSLIEIVPIVPDPVETTVVLDKFIYDDAMSLLESEAADLDQSIAQLQDLQRKIRDKVDLLRSAAKTR